MTIQFINLQSLYLNVIVVYLINVIVVYLIPSALDKPLCRSGIYATWLSSIAYLQKQLRIFFICLCNQFDSDYKCFLIEPSQMCLHIYSHRLPFLSIKLADLYCT